MARVSPAPTFPLNLPAGWEFDKVFGGERAPAPAPAERRADVTPAGRADVYAAVAVARSPQPAPQVRRRGDPAQRRDAAEDGNRRRAAAVVRSRTLLREPAPDA